MKNDSPSVPSLVNSLVEHEFFSSQECLRIAHTLDGVFENILEGFLSKKIIKKIECMPIKDKVFLILYKIFYTDTKYFKVFFKFSELGEFLEVYLNNKNLFFPNSLHAYKNDLKTFFMNEIKSLRLGIRLEEEYDQFLKIFEKNNLCCISFVNTANDIIFDPIGIDFNIKFKKGLMPLQVKGSCLYIENHLKVHSEIPLIISSIGEKYESGVFL